VLNLRISGVYTSLPNISLWSGNYLSTGANLHLLEVRNLPLEAINITDAEKLS
jgi:hypothetical protein